LHYLPDQTQIRSEIALYILNQCQTVLLSRKILRVSPSPNFYHQIRYEDPLEVVKVRSDRKVLFAFPYPLFTDYIYTSEAGIQLSYSSQF
jgi:hypothetical protein